MDFYGIDWEYEPHAFAIEFDEDGQPTKYFRPDFYLPAENVYIEITTMSQKLVTKKNRKVKQLRRWHPEINCKVFYQRDYLHLLVKYGLEEPDASIDSPAPTRIPGPPNVIDLGRADELLDEDAV
ncbi:MAG: hypothetical protein QNJ71_05520 [Acidimicrobiia bacterium]|nr:hypothetical protein [Acidimicrobiia bacterium]